jgi:hypothetical protein
MFSNISSYLVYGLTYFMVAIIVSPNNYKIIKTIVQVMEIISFIISIWAFIILNSEKFQSWRSSETSSGDKLKLNEMHDIVTFMIWLRMTIYIFMITFIVLYLVFYCFMSTFGMIFNRDIVI